MWLPPSNTVDTARLFLIGGTVENAHVGDTIAVRRSKRGAVWCTLNDVIDEKWEESVEIAVAKFCVRRCRITDIFWLLLFIQIAALSLMPFLFLCVVLFRPVFTPAQRGKELEDKWWLHPASFIVVVFCGRNSKRRKKNDGQTLQDGSQQHFLYEENKDYNRLEQTTNFIAEESIKTRHCKHSIYIANI